MRKLIAALLILGCGVDTAQNVQAGGEVVTLAAPAKRCTVGTLEPGWECCDDNGLKCSEVSSAFYVCAQHKWIPLTDSKCAELRADPRTPELATYGTLCDRVGQGWATCEKPPLD